MRTAAFWILWIASLSFAAWAALAPAGYLPYTWQWLSHLRYGAIWDPEQKAISQTVVLPELEAWAQAIAEDRPAAPGTYVHEDGTPIPPVDWRLLHDRYAARGIDIIQQPSYSLDGTGDPGPLISALLARQPFKLEELYRRIAQRLAACAPPTCDHQPRVAWVYVMFAEPNVMIHWPGGSQRARFKAGLAPSLAYDGPERGNMWLRNAMAQDSLFEAASGDSLGFGDTMTTVHRIAFAGQAGIVGADVYWEESQIQSLRWIVAASSLWAAVSALAIVYALVEIAATRSRMLRAGNGVCVTIDIVGWSRIDDVTERFDRQRALDAVLVRAFLYSTRQRLVRWSTGDGYHVLFMDHWGADMYREVLIFVREVLSRWDYRLGGGVAAGANLRISVGSHGAVRLRWRNGAWMCIGDRIVSAVRIDEVSKPHRQTDNSRWIVAVEQSFRNEARLAAKVEYDAMVREEIGPIAAADKAGQSHSFSLLRIEPRRGPAHRTLIARLLRSLAGLARRLSGWEPPVGDRVGEAGQ
jgi:hypothetical protein